MVVVVLTTLADARDCSHSALCRRRFSNWEGGIRVVAMVSGGALPAPMHGRKLDALITAWECAPPRALSHDTHAARLIAANMPPPSHLLARACLRLSAVQD